jgi:hypothetical protein
MSKRNNISIVFASGCYGHWVNWCVRYFGRGEDIPLPFNDNGNSHNLPFSKFYNNTALYLNDTSSNDIVAMHPVSEACENLKDTLLKVSECSHKTIFITPDKNTALLAWNNKFTKVRDEWFTPYMAQIEKDTLDGWDKNWSEMSTWQRREFLSYYWWPARLSEHNVQSLEDFNYPEHESLNIFTVKLSDLRDNFSDTITKMLNYLCLDQKRSASDIKIVYSAWAKLQKHFYKDNLVEEIINSIITDVDMEWGPLTLIDEATIQMILRDVHKLDLMCYELDQFPENTKALRSKLEPI